MYCTTCCFPLEEGDRFCPQCGMGKVDEGRWAGHVARRKLRRSASDRRVAGVCEGVARRYNVDVTLVRLGWTGASLLPFMPGLFAYVILWALLPSDDAMRESAA